MYEKTQTQIRCAVTSQLISAFDFFSRKKTLPLLLLTEILSYLNHTDPFVSGLVGNPQDKCSRYATHIVDCNGCKSFMH